MSETRPRLTIMTIFSFLCVLVFAVSSSVQADSGEMIDLKGTGSAGSFSYGEGQSKKGQVWEEKFPKDLELKIKTNTKEVDPDPYLEQKFNPETNQLKVSKEKGQGRPKRDRSHLRVIK